MGIESILTKLLAAKCEFEGDLDVIGRKCRKSMLCAYEYYFAGLKYCDKYKKYKK